MNILAIPGFLFGAGGVILIIIVFFIFLYFVPLGLWFSAILSKVKISLLDLIFMRWRKVPPEIIVKGMVNATKAGLVINSDMLEAHYLAGLS